MLQIGFDDRIVAVLCRHFRTLAAPVAEVGFYVGFRKGPHRERAADKLECGAAVRLYQNDSAVMADVDKLFLGCDDLAAIWRDVLATRLDLMHPYLIDTGPGIQELFCDCRSSLRRTLSARSLSDVPSECSLRFWPGERSLMYQFAEPARWKM